MTVDYPPTSIDDPEWESIADQILVDGDYDPDLGKRMARDAVRVANGDLDEGEFHRKYHDEVVEEFGRDDRPTAPEGFNE
jgi:hypothetical protein